MITDVQFSDQRWLDFWENFKNEPHQIAAVTKLGRHIKQADAGLLTESADWVSEWRKPVAPKKANPLPIKWQSQLDNQSGTGYRECFSSSCAMLAMYWGKVANDDAYNKVRAKYGDSTSAQAQLSALRALGLKADFATNGTTPILQDEIDEGRPVAVGWLHHGTHSNPQGDGHWSVVGGYSNESWIMFDPNGVADLIRGGYTPSKNGAGVNYARKYWDPRWRVKGTGGWYLRCRL